MAIRHQVTKLSNPHFKRAVKRAVAWLHPAKVRTRRNMSPKQIKYFGTKRQRAALHRKRSNVAMGYRSRTRPKGWSATTPVKFKRNSAHSSRMPFFRATKRRPSKRPAKRSINPALVVTLGSMNPRKRRNKPVAATKRRRRAPARATNVRHHRRRVAASNPRRHRRRTPAVNRRRHTNRRRAVVHHHRRRSPVMNRRHRHSNPRKVYVINRRRNPSLFGSSLTSKEGLKLIGGGFVGLIGAKFLPTLIPISMAGSFMSSNIGRVVVTGIAGYATALVAGKIGGERFGDAALFGAIIQTASVALNAFLPSIYSSLGIGLGDFVPGRFSVPQNPLLSGQKGQRALPAAAPASSMAPTGSVMVNSGMGRAYPAAY